MTKYLRRHYVASCPQTNYCMGRCFAAMGPAADTDSSPVSIQTQSLALRKRKPQETQALALTSSQSWLPLLRLSIPIGWRLRLLRENFTQQTQAITFEWKPGLSLSHLHRCVHSRVGSVVDIPAVLVINFHVAL